LLKKLPGEPIVAPKEKSIAVLYFENMSSEKESDYFCAGITEDIITDLSKIKQLKVISRTDVLPFRNKEVNTRQVGEALGVKYVLEGSVRKSGNKIRITAQLIDVRDGFHVWADRFDRLVEDIFDLQNEVSQKIAEALKVSFTDTEKPALPHKPTDDVRAYDFYMRGREYLNTRGKRINEKAIQMFEHALAFDPNFALAYAALAEAYANMYLWYDGDPQWLGKTIQMNQKALALQSDLLEAQFGIAMVYLYQKRFTEAKKTLDRIIQNKPDSYDAIRWLGIIADITGNYESAVQYYHQAAVIKPYSEEPWMHLDMTYRRIGNEEASNEAAQKIIEIGARKFTVNPDDVLTLSRMAVPYARFGDKERAQSAIQRVMDLAPGDGLALYNCACTYTGLGAKQDALISLRRSLELGGNVVREWVKSDPYLDSLRGDPDFETLLAEFT
jgi:adenylate cyclase